MLVLYVLPLWTMVGRSGNFVFGLFFYLFPRRLHIWESVSYHPPICGIAIVEHEFFLCQPFPQIARVFHNFMIVIHRFGEVDQKNGRFW